MAGGAVHDNRRIARMATMMAIGVGVVCGCVDQTDPPALAVAALDRATFELDSGPLLATRCGDALCHGRKDRPFVLFSVGRHRSNPGDTFTAKPLTAAERDRNYQSTLGFVDDALPRRTTLLRKALGQMAHKGGVVFEAPSDPPFLAVAAWLTGETAARRAP